ncbi:MAG: glycosyltransferase family 4 protein [Candidatus Roizmanbacteria bacterium]|nr:glycosyltransferase family 4 protein [Candidatus Roizmanbacteria bacterium]
MMRVAIVRGKHLNQYEAQSYYSMPRTVHITAFGSRTSMHAHYPFIAKNLWSPADVTFSNRYVLGIINRIFVDAHYLGGLEQSLKGFDIAHTADTYYGFTWQCLQAKRKGYVKKVVATVWENIPFANEGIRGRKDRKQQALQEVDWFLAVSHDAQEALLKEGCDRKKITVIYPGVDVNRFKPRTQSTHKPTFDLLYVGRLVPEKGIWILFQAYTKLRKKYPHVQLRLCGRGREEHKLRALGATVISSSYDHLPAVYQAADCCIVPSLETATWKEQFGMVLPEAMASGLPIIASNTGSIPEVLGAAGLLVKPGSISALCRAIEQYMNHTSVLTSYTKKARNRAVNVFDAKQAAQKVYSIYKKVLSQS